MLMIFKGDFFKVDKLETGFLELVFDAKNSKLNILSQAAIADLAQAISAIKNSGIQTGLIICSAKKGFVAGADITEFSSVFKSTGTEFLSILSACNNVFNAIEDLPMPTVAAINGDALGGGFELALAADYRVAATGIKVGFPEVNLGIIPGFGGTVRLPRLIGLDNALTWITTGVPKKAEIAFKVGAIDSLVDADILHETAQKTLQQCLNAKLDYNSRRAEKKNALTLPAAELTMAFETAKGMVQAKVGGNYPAPMAVVLALEEAATMERDDAIAVEAKAFTKVAKTAVSASLIGLFFNSQVIKKIAINASKITKPVKQSAVLGAGIMGGGISYQSALKGVPVVMRDITDSALELGVNEATKQLNKKVKRGQLNAADMSDILSDIKPTLDINQISDIDIVVEAVVENPKIKQAVLAEVETIVRNDAIITSNTSTISINHLATALQKPERFCGMHFFNPVPVMQLVEVIRGEKTSDQTIATVVSYATKMGKTPIVVNDCPGFLVNRVLFPYLHGFNLLIRDGADFRQIDKVMETFGWPMGPAYLQDVIGIDTCHHCIDVMVEGFPDRFSYEGKSILDLLYDSERFGQKNGKGYFNYNINEKGRLQKTYNEEIEYYINQASSTKAEFSDEEIIARMMIPMCLETARCIEDNIVNSAAEADMAQILGIGFPKFRGGSLRYIDNIGTQKFCDLADKYAHLGGLYKVPDGLRLMAKNSQSFF